LNKPRLWNYKGEYRVHSYRVLPVEMWNREYRTTRIHWVRFIFGTVYPEFVSLWARVYLRNHNIPLTPENIQARIEENHAAFARLLQTRNLTSKKPITWKSQQAQVRSKACGVSFEEMENAISTGQEHLHLRTIECIGYDFEFQQRLIDSYLVFRGLPRRLIKKEEVKDEIKLEELDIKHVKKSLSAVPLKSRSNWKKSASADKSSPFSPSPLPNPIRRSMRIKQRLKEES